MAALEEDMIVNIKEEPEDPLVEQNIEQNFAKSDIKIKNEYSACESNTGREFVFVNCGPVPRQDSSPSGLSGDQNHSGGEETSPNTHTEKQFVCAICNKQLSGKLYLNRHMIIHSGVKNFQCTICNKKFLRKRDLQRHKEIHSEINESKRFECPTCNKPFRRKDNLIGHIKSHTGVKSFKCTICNKEYLRKEDLIKHTIIHYGVTEFKCTICNEQFTHKSNLISHMKIHVIGSQCTICDKQFAHKSSLRRHLVHHTSIKKFSGPHDHQDSSLRIKIENEEPIPSPKSYMNIRKETELMLLEQQHKEEHFPKNDIEIKDEFDACESNTIRKMVFVKYESESPSIQDGDANDD